MSTITAHASDITPDARDFRAYRGDVWRLVEAQHRISTNRLTADAGDQVLLEQLVEEAKPALPPAAHRLHYLLATPFRYGYKKGSRFRAAGERPGIFYASEQLATAIAETAYWRLLFFSRSPGFTPPNAVVEHSAFTVAIAVDRLIDLTAPPFAQAAARWRDPDDYSACRALAGAARRIDTQAIRYTSVRDPDSGANVALLDPSGFAARTPRIEQTWHFRYESGRITAFAAFPSNERYSFSCAQFGL
ncbi:RES domain-containing protein [Hephaestia caeni]|uniref:RES domain-containing protein n=1 Tax=Hephaestia caeni TaxID=645617 RepID=A0A397P773_9SPHN|nr:RES family NAD+ phosphorylase [Hephaestia caeni]RIA43899.1 RES domain-containing protein [Hephaestia caeni]